MNYKESIDTLNRMRKRTTNSWLPYFLGTPILYGKTKVYRFKGMCRNMIKSLIRTRPTPEEDIEKIISRLESYKMLEFRQLGDLSPMFPYNVANVTKEQADKFKAMIDSPDNEMMDLALTILEEIQKE